MDGLYIEQVGQMVLGGWLEDSGWVETLTKFEGCSYRKNKKSTSNNGKQPLYLTAESLLQVQGITGTWNYC